jgi:putative peptide zinc metalloprotease protein
MMLLWGVPLPYIDVTSSWSFRSKWPRVYTAAAGLYAELSAASLATLVWSQSPPGGLSFFCVHLVAVAGAGTILFNANPLMRFDGYYILMDLLEMPNLDGYGRQFLGAMVRKYVWGQRAILPGRNRLARHFIGWYGLASWIWRWVLCAGLTVLTLAMLPLDDADVLIPAAVILALGGAWQFIRFVSAKSSHEKPGLARLLAAGGLAAIAGGLCMTCVPWPGGTTAPAVVDYSPLRVVRAYAPGFIREIGVRSGEAIREGQVIAVIVNDELESDLADLELAVEESRLAMRSCQAKEDTAGCQAEREKLEDLQHRLAERREQVGRLVVLAPTAGRVVTRQPESLAGRFVRPGDEIVAIGSEEAKELRVSVAQDDVQRFLPRVGQPLGVRIGGEMMVSRLSRVEPRASLTLPHLALSAAEGGPLPVRPKDLAEGDRSSREKTEREKYELLAPRFAAQVVLSASESLTLGAGQRGQVVLQPGEEMLGVHGAKLAYIWARDKVRQVRAVWQ